MSVWGFGIGVWDLEGLGIGDLGFGDHGFGFQVYSWGVRG